MTNRREFLQIGIAASTWPITAQAKGLSKSTVAYIPFYKAIFDTRYADSVSFASHLQKQQVKTHSIAGDITPFWFNELDAIWKKEPVAIAGMTAHGPLFVLERLAWERGMRVVYRAEHQLNNDGIIQHKLSGPQAMLEKSKTGTLSLASLNNQWSEGIAKLMLECPLGHTAVDKLSLTAPTNVQAAETSEVDVLADPLISWIIAPAQKV